MLANPDPLALATDGYLGGQLKQYLADAATNPPEEGTAAALWFGANDYNALPPDAPPELVEQTIAAVVGNTIAAAGAIAADRGRADPALQPAGAGVPAAAAAAGVRAGRRRAQRRLAQGVALLASQDIDAEIVDMHRIGGEIVADPRTFGLNPAYLDQPLLLGIGSQPIWVPETQNWFIPANLEVAGVDPDRVAFRTPCIRARRCTASSASSPRRASPKPGVPRRRGRARWTGPVDDLVLGGGGNDRIFSARRRRTPCSPGSATTRLVAGAGRDIVAGGAGDDRVHGGPATTWSRAPTATTSRPAAGAAT